MKKLPKLGLATLLLLGLNGCWLEEESYWDTEESYWDTPAYITTDGVLPQWFSLQIQNNTIKNFEYWIENPNKEVSFLRKIKRESIEKVYCKEYSNELTLVAYDCEIIFSDKDREIEHDSLVIEKGVKYMFRYSGNAPKTYINGEYIDYHAVKKDIMEIYIPKEEE